MNITEKILARGAGKSSVSPDDVVFAKKKAQWPLKKQATLEILDECPSYNEQRLPEFYKRMGFPDSKN